MAVLPGIFPDDIGSSSDRAPLQPLPSSPPPATGKRIRRKSSFIRLPDSSEDDPSSHDSIYEAVYFSGSNSDASNNRIELIDIPPRRSGPVVQNDENKRVASKASNDESLPTIDEVEFRYGWGTALETITEQKSYGTLRTLGHTRSADDIPSLLGHRDSFSISKSLRRKASFSLDDIKSYHEACLTIETQIFKLPINEVYAEPKTPIQAPPNRPPTPEGMPSWTAAQNVPVRPGHSPQPPPAQNAFQRFFGLPASGITLSSRVPPPGTDPRAHRSVRGRMAPRFRAPRSAYGPIDQHPFANAPLAQAKTQSQADTAQASGPRNLPDIVPAIGKKNRRRKLQRVRFTASATARDSEMMSIQAAMDTTTSLAVHPLSPIPPMQAIRDEPSAKRCPHRRRKTTKNNVPEIVIATIDPVSQDPPATPFLTVTRPSATLAVPRRSSSIGGLSRATNSTTSLVTDDPRSRTTSYSSTTYLMSGGRRSPSGSTVQPQPTLTSPANVIEPEERFCWKCTTGKANQKIGHWLNSSASCFCFVCCGFDTDDETEGANSGYSSYGGYTRGSGGSSSHEELRTRRVTLDHSPAGIS